MTVTLQNELLEWATAWVRAHSLDRTLVSAINEDTALLGSGVLDSVSFVELLVAIEEKLGTTIDLADAEPEDFETARALCGYAVKQAGGAA